MYCIWGRIRLRTLCDLTIEAIIIDEVQGPKLFQLCRSRFSNHQQTSIDLEGQCCCFIRN